MKKEQIAAIKNLVWKVEHDPTQTYDVGKVFTHKELKELIVLKILPSGMILVCGEKKYIVNLFHHIVDYRFADP